MTEQEKQEVAGMFGWDFVQQLEDEKRAKKSNTIVKMVALGSLSTNCCAFIYYARSIEDFMIAIVLYILMICVVRNY
ncbi:MAG: hypothetical protein J5680_07310 [Neisseriaceae bacterium]|nr:hypothetical protein [Neisseriaceae bacterium]